MIIVRYLTRETLKSQIAVLFVLFLVFISQKFIRILADASDGSIPSDLIMTLMGLSIPSMALLMLPLSLYIGILLTFGRLYAESEITVMNATGMGNKLLLQSALALAIITGSIAAVNALWLAPWSQDHVEQVMEKAKAGPGINMLVKGRFQDTPDGKGVVFVDDITEKGSKLSKVFIAQLKATESLQPSVMVADRGLITEQPDGRQMLELNDGTRYEGIPTQLNYSITHFNNYQALIGQREVKQGNRDWEAIPTFDLMKEGSLAAKAELQWRFSLILCIPLLVMIVVPLSAVNPRQGRFAKLAPAVLIYLAYFLAISSAKSAIEDGIIPSGIGMWPINIATLLVALGLNSWDSMPVRRLKDKLRRRS
ncbi:LPS export ABC transporter permease LptF [Photobacterium leiognathi]|uniref:Lipopolysaccharide export system permease protein LptF n=1 Tax=Photobacterium leiognathi TaxID=553611 RepID=A0A2T3M8T2_PHOLE|nr:LPS export ABC transporter permease LptF [Photobacterium leiognathi]KJF90678.1 lipopolysaccharide ABC transporter permease [Photobacterium leiognathi]KJF98425.1 lipopolysaccharide ABC transporter permease [Photobacterium leiognathi]PSV81670.1 LPS export ABC transporter permease LptF [Photobacterium leiognathi]PSV88949.1 LPS export ABC transporter permease LptF [Photobacterium leiognathi]